MQMRFVTPQNAAAGLIQADDAFDVAALQKISARVARSWFLQKTWSGTRMRQLRMLPGLRNTRRSSTIGLIEP